MKTIPMDSAGRVVLPKEVRSRLNLHPGDRLEPQVGHDQVTLRLVRVAPARLSSHNGRVVWDVPEASPTVADFESALTRGRADRDQRATGI